MSSVQAMTATTWDAEVPGGTIRVAEWGDPADPVVLAVHGITANHRAWEPLARVLPRHRLLAVDLRGRGRSADLSGPYGMERHARDLVSVLDSASVTKAFVVGHSMGASVAVVLRHLAARRVDGLLLVDGGLPLPRAQVSSPEEAVRRLLGPAVERLSMTFPDREAYQQFWRRHPAFKDEWLDAVVRYVDYDLVEVPDGFRSSVRRAAVEADFVDQMDGAALHDAQDALAEVEFGFLRAPRGLMNDLPGLFPVEQMARFERRFHRMRWLDVDNVNHYTILLADRGADAIGSTIDELTRPAST